MIAIKDWLKSVGKTLRRVAPALLAAMAFAFTSAWTADALKGATPFYDWQGLTAKEVSFAQKSGWALLLFALSLVSAYLLYVTRRTWVPVRSLGKYVGKPQKVLVICLSTPDLRHKGFDLGDGKKIDLHSGVDSSNASVEHLAVCNISYDIKACSALGEKRVNWQQSLRAIHFHSSTLEHLFVVPSIRKTYKDGSEEKGSEDYYAPFLELLEHYLSKPEWPHRFKVKKRPAVDYEDFEQLQAAFLDVLKYAKTEISEESGKPFKESEIVFDITAGQKVPSVAAAMVTLNTRADFQYVQTFKEKGRESEIITYAVVAESPLDT